jgi:hypothetical protein
VTFSAFIEALQQLFTLVCVRYGMARHNKDLLSQNQVSARGCASVLFADYAKFYSVRMRSVTSPRDTLDSA